MAVFRNDSLDRLSDQFVTTPAVGRLGRPIEIDDGPLEVLDDDRVRRIHEHLGHALAFRRLFLQS